ncbi:hypothetical protein F4821DRAFT_222464 [Hypoxylon rubiginosum]|uniref:Uncharacterized protein n=1 Tax=Hypoxylon rubiginosum TaxID=110542 RepID=A0ACC0DKB9_9PEZI|nr:hypothetical protein F4821DRAFT_222464 [Hypoxylon rubiginosum]
MMFIKSYDFLWRFRFLFLFGTFHSAHAVQNWPITAPVADEVVLVGQPYTIRWENNTQGPVAINLNYDQQPVVITSSTVNNGTFMWIPASVLAGDNDYYLSICDVNLDSSEFSVTYAGRFHIALSVSSTTTATSSTPSITPSISSTTESTTTTTPASTPSITSTISSPTPLSSSNSGSTTGLNTGAVVGVTVGTTAALLAVAAFGFWAYKKTKKKPLVLDEISVPPMIEHIPGYPKPELSGEIPSASDLMRLHSHYNGPVELYTDRGPYELGGNTVR